MNYLLGCNNNHTLSLDPSDLQSFIEEGDFCCHECNKDLELQEQLSLECPICNMTAEVDSLVEASMIAEMPCDHCSQFTESAYFRVPTSHAEEVDIYEWTRVGADPNALSRSGRTDYWEGLIHFCNRSEFISIFDDNAIKAFPTGYFKAPAVCLTETPSADCDELKKRHGDYGYVFRKSDIIKIHGNPALYLGTNLINAQLVGNGFTSAIRPFVNLLRTPKNSPKSTPHDFLYEREWRVPSDIRLDHTKPFGIVLPSKTGRSRFGGKGGQIILAAAQMFGELT